MVPFFNNPQLCFHCSESGSGLSSAKRSLNSTPQAFIPLHVSITSFWLAACHVQNRHNYCWMNQALNLQRAQGQFTVECEASGIKVSSSASQSASLKRKTVECSSNSLPQRNEFKYLQVAWRSNCEMKQDTCRQIKNLVWINESIIPVCADEETAKLKTIKSLNLLVILFQLLLRSWVEEQGPTSKLLRWASSVVQSASALEFNSSLVKITVKMTEIKSKLFL